MLPEEEPLPSWVYIKAWVETYKVFSESMNQEACDVMDSVLDSIIADFIEEKKQRR